jgi:hypothetical protein
VTYLLTLPRSICNEIYVVRGCIEHNFTFILPLFYNRFAAFLLYCQITEDLAYQITVIGLYVKRLKTFTPSTCAAGLPPSPLLLTVHLQLVVFHSKEMNSTGYYTYVQKVMKCSYMHYLVTKEEIVHNAFRKKYC